MNKYDLRKKKLKQLKKIADLKDEPLKPWCDCTGNPGKHHLTVTSNNETCDNCNHYVHWAKEKPQVGYFGKSDNDIEVEYTEDKE